MKKFFFLLASSVFFASSLILIGLVVYFGLIYRSNSLDVVALNTKLSAISLGCLLIALWLLKDFFKD